MASQIPGYSKPFPGPGAPAGYYILEGVGERYYTKEGKWRYGSPGSSGQVTIPGANLPAALNLVAGHLGLGTSERASKAVNRQIESGYGLHNKDNKTSNTNTNTTATSAGNAGTALSNEGMEYVPGTPSGLKGHPLPIRWKSDVNKTPGDELNIDKQPPRRPLRDADPLPTTLAEAYESLGPRAVGNTTLGRLIGTPNNSGFIELTPEMQQEIAGVWSNDMMSPTNVVQYDKSIFEEPPVAFSPSEVPVSFDYGDLKLTSGINDHVMPGLTPKTGLQALRADEESQGLLYASGKYWAENADGKLEAIPSDLINGEGTARQQAIAFMQSKKQPIIEAIQDKVQQGVGNSTDVTATGFQSLKLPGSGLPEFDRVSGMNPDGTSKTEDQIDREFREVQNQQAELAQGIRFRQ